MSIAVGYKIEKMIGGVFGMMHGYLPVTQIEQIPENNKKLKVFLVNADKD